jgi:hypothetical protein
VDHLRDLRRHGETAKGQIEAMDQMIDETIEKIMSLLGKVPEAASCAKQSSTSKSAAVRKAHN